MICYSSIYRRRSGLAAVFSAVLLLALLAFVFANTALAADLYVANRAELVKAISAAKPGDTVALAPGDYAGGLAFRNLNGITLRSIDPADQAVFVGGTNNIQLVDAVNVTLQDLTFRNAAANGLNIDDGGSFDTPAQNITLRNLTLLDIGSKGNHDGIKLSGVVGFHLDRIRILNWGVKGSGIDITGSHNGLVENSWLRNERISDYGSAIRPKGGSSNVTIRANRIELPNNKGRGLQFGGRTDAKYRRYVDAGGYEARNIVAEGNVIEGGSSAFNVVNIDGGVFHSNVAYLPSKWVMRVLNENRGSLVETQNTAVLRNIIITKAGLLEAVNTGPLTRAATMQFDSNSWSGGAPPKLPSIELNGRYGAAPALNMDGVTAWPFGWGLWLVNTTDKDARYELENARAFQQMNPVGRSSFNPLSSPPVSGEWRPAAARSTVKVPAFSQVVLIKGNGL